MSVDFSAHAGIGVLVPRKKLFARVQVRRCGHPLPASGKWCPECGKELWHEQEQPIPGFNYEDRAIAGLSCIEMDYNGQEWLLAPILISCDPDDDPYDCMPLTEDGINEARRLIRAALKSVGLHDDSFFSTFGLYCIASVS